MGRASGRKGWTRLIESVSHGRDRAARDGRSAGDGGKGRGGGGGSVLQAGWRSDALSRLAILERAVGRLPLFKREAWWLAARDDLTCREIGDRLGISVEEVLSYLTAALAALVGGQGNGSREA